MAAGDLLGRAQAFGIEAHEVDGQDVLAVNALAQDLVARARRGKGPFFMALNTYRYHGHHVGDINRSYYRTKEEEEGELEDGARSDHEFRRNGCSRRRSPAAEELERDGRRYQGGRRSGGRLCA